MVMICRDCDAESEYHVTGLCVCCRNKRIVELKEELKGLES